MENSVDLLNDICRLMALKGENPFKVRAYEKASQSIADRDDLVERARAGTLTEIPGVGKGISDVLTEFLINGTSSVRDELEKSLPAGLLELTQVPGLGPKKALSLIEQLGIQSLGELEYACKENRLLKLRGFGPKLQEKILEGISFRSSTQGLQKLSDVDSIAQDFLRALQACCPGGRVSESGALRRKLETLSTLEFLVEQTDSQTRVAAESLLSQFLSRHGKTLPIQLYFSTPEKFGYELARTTGSLAHWAALGVTESFDASTEEEFYDRLGLPWIPPETRETGEEVTLARSGYLSRLLPWKGIRGIFHNHTTRSDGAATLEQMVSAAEQQGYEYIGISDHSQSAFYAQGLNEEMLLEQQKEIQEVQKKHPAIRIFWGVESDILADGSLDYHPKILARFDFVIASIHSRFKMDRQAMTDRILEAIRNPFTRFLGHPTGRLLLGRKGYDVDMEAIIAEAARHDVAIELNANPVRLDLDWRWGPEMRKRNTLTSINPDAHEVAGLEDTQYGIVMARKALISADRVINSRSTIEVEKWLKRA